jgi:ABC-2 type transport system permease protein
VKRSMPRGFTYEFRRTWLRAPIVLIIVIGILLALAATTQVAANPPSFARMYSGVLYYSDGFYHFDFYAFNQFGDPLSGVNYTVAVFNASGTGLLLRVSGNTPSNGTLDLTALLPEGTYTANVTAGPQSSGSEPTFFWSQGESFGVVDIEPLPAGTVVPILSPIATAVDLPTGFSGESALQIYFPSPNGTCESDCSVYYTLVNLTSGPGPGPLPETSMTLIGFLRSSLQTFPLAIVPTSDTQSLSLQIEIFSPSGSIIALDTNTSAISYTPYVSSNSVADSAFAYFAFDMLFVLPLLAIVCAFAVYARDRISGVLESTLVQPITRRALAVSRFFAVLAALLISVGVGMLVSDLLIQLIVGYFVLPAQLVATFSGCAIVATFFVGLVFLLSHWLRSTATLFGVAVALFLLFGVFWGSITSTLGTDFGALAGTNVAAEFQVKLSFCNPLGYSGLIFAGITNTTPPGAAEFATSAAGYGVTPETLILSGLAWTVVPFLLLLWRIRARD